MSSFMYDFLGLITSYFCYHKVLAKLEHFVLILDYQIMKKLLIFRTVGSKTSAKYQNNRKIVISRNAIALLLTVSNKSLKKIFQEYERRSARRNEDLTYIM